MIVRPSYLMPTFSSAAAKTRALGSSARLAMPLMMAANHLLGFVRRLVCWVRSDTVAEQAGMARSFWCYRHPNCGYLHLLIYTGTAAHATAELEVQAGTGTAVSVGPSLYLTNQWLELLAPWGSSDSGWCEVTITGTDVGFHQVMVHELYSPTLDTDTQMAIANVEEAFPLGGLREGHTIIESEKAGIKGLIQQTKNAWDEAPRHAVTYWSDSTDDYIDSKSWTNPFTAGGSGQTFLHRARRQRAEATRDYRVYAWTYGAGTVSSYEWRVRSGSDTVTSGSLSQTSGAWTGGPLTGLAVDAETDDELTFEMRRTGGSGRVYVQRLGIAEDKS